MNLKLNFIVIPLSVAMVLYLAWNLVPRKVKVIPNNINDNKFQSRSFNQNIRKKVLADHNWMKSRINNPKYSAKLREYIKTSLRERSGDEGSLIELAEILLTNGYKDEAKEILEMVLRDNPEDVSALMFTAQYYIDNDNLEDLYYFFNSTIEQFPANFEIYHNFAILFTEKLEFRYALQLLSSGIEKASNNPEIRYIFGDHLEILEKYEEAIDQYKIALELNRENPEGYFKIGMIYKKMGQKYLAKEWFDKAISISIEYDEIIRSQI